MFLFRTRGITSPSVVRLINRMLSSASWRSLPCCLSELRLDISLACGQSFRWKESNHGEWTGVLSGYVWTLKQNNEEILYQVHNESPDPQHFLKSKRSEDTSIKKEVEREGTCFMKEERNTKDNLGCSKIKTDHQVALLVDENLSKYESILRDYFQLHINLKKLYDQWSKADENFASIASTFTGVRILRQDPVENLFSFICSSNNHISRISGMVERMCEMYGEELFVKDGTKYYSFPTIEKLAGAGVEEMLRGLGFGYRAKFISESAKYILKNHSREWLYSLRDVSYEEAKSELLHLCGVGAKVADCVCLMSLDKLGAIPVDTHVWQIAARNYMLKLRTAKSITPTIYKEIGDHFRRIWGPYAGWAHSVLFSADLKKFQGKKAPPGSDTKAVQQPQKEVKKVEKERKRVSADKKAVSKRKKAR